MNSILEIDAVIKDYRGLRPLRIKELSIAASERVGLVGFDRPSAEVFVNLVTGQFLPDAGRIVAFGQPTSDIPDSARWLEFVDRFGIVSERAVLVEPLTALQNLAMPFSLSVDPMAEDIRRRSEALAREIALDPTAWDALVGELDALSRMRVRLGRALALGPSLLLLEHVNAGLETDVAAGFGREIAAIADRRSAAVAVLTVDESFARVVAQRVLRWDPASGRLAARRGWFGGRLG